MRDRIVAGNWKMNMNAEEARSLYASLKQNTEGIMPKSKVVIAPPSIYLSEFSNNLSDNVLLAAQNCSENNNGAYTGEISASMLVELGVSYCLVGHSERRQYQKEDGALLKKKVDLLLDNQVTPIFCCGETLGERENGNAFKVVENQLNDSIFHLTDKQIVNVVIAYEPVWAIGTGKTASSDQAQEIHGFIRNLIKYRYSAEIADEISILYGGSCKPENAAELFSQADIDGGLIGGASLKADSFIDIVQA